MPSPSAADFPRRVYEALSLALDRPVEELQALMEILIEEWKRQAGDVMRRFGYEELVSIRCPTRGHYPAAAGAAA